MNRLTVSIPTALPGGRTLRALLLLSTVGLLTAVSASAAQRGNFEFVKTFGTGSAATSVWYDPSSVHNVSTNIGNLVSLDYRQQASNDSDFVTTAYFDCAGHLYLVAVTGRVGGQTVSADDSSNPAAWQGRQQPTAVPAGEIDTVANVLEGIACHR